MGHTHTHMGHTQIPKETHEVWRPFFIRLVQNPLKIWKRASKSLKTITNPLLRELKRKQIFRAAVAAQKEYIKLYKCVYQDHMLYVWLWYPKFARATARCLGLAVGMGIRCMPPSADNDEDQFLLGCFNECKQNVKTLWTQFQMTNDEQEEIMKMSRTDCATFTGADMSTTFPALDKFLFVKFDGLCLANHYQARVVIHNPDPLSITLSLTLTFTLSHTQEGLFSSKKTIQRQNHSAERVDNQMQFKHNDLQQFRAARIAEANAEAASKGLTTKYKSPISTRAQCVTAGRQYKCFADTKLIPTNFVHPDCPTNRR